MSLRSIGLPALLAFASIQSTAIAQVTPQNRIEAASGGIEVVVASRGISRLPAECATFKITVRETAPSAAEARTKVRSTVDQLTAELVRLGIPRSNFSVEESALQTGFIGNEAYVGDLPPELQAAMAKRPKFASSVMTLAVMDLSRLPQVRDLLRDRESLFVEGPQFALKDDQPARRAAIADAVSRARVDAEAYASALGMKVLRIARVRDLAAEASLTQGYEEMMARIIHRSSVMPSMVETNVRVAVEFVMAPR